MESYTNYSYEDKLVITDSTFDKNNILTSTNSYTYDGNDRLLDWETYRLGSLYMKSEYKYSGSSYTKKTYYMSNNTGRLQLWQETHYEGKNETLWIYYDEEGNEDSKDIYTYEGNLRVREDIYYKGVLNRVIINTYESNLIKEKKKLNGSNQLERLTRYYYEGDFLTRSEEYDQSSVMNSYKIYTKNGTNSIMEKSYYMPDNILTSTTVKEYNEKNDLIYQKIEYTDINYIERFTQITYNECDCIITRISQYKNIYLSTPQYNEEGYNHYENEGVECPL
ncbi:hypothetical protein [Bernardetia sp. MNP-M8]|uniref:hypothetical protein n=1 Tax=Bernardetia sp. MNP-M8 TaxID=3127470 RepID=UPI0030CF086B